MFAEGDIRMNANIHASNATYRNVRDRTGSDRTGQTVAAESGWGETGRIPLAVWWCNEPGPLSSQASISSCNAGIDEQHNRPAQTTKLEETRRVLVTQKMAVGPRQKKRLFVVHADADTHHGQISLRLK